MIESEKGESCLFNMASSKAAHSLLGTKGLGNNSSQFEQSDALPSSNLIPVKMNPPDSVRVCKKVPDRCLQNNSAAKVTIAPSITIKKVLTEPLNGISIFATTREVISSETDSSTEKAELTMDSGNKVEGNSDQIKVTSTCNKNVATSVQNDCNRENNEKHKWPSEENCVPHKNPMLKSPSTISQNSKTVKLKLSSPSPSSASKDELDDVSIDLTEEEEDALLGKHETSDMETDTELQGPISANNLLETEDGGCDKLDPGEWKVLDETEASTCSSEHSPRVSIEGMSPGSVSASPCHSTPKLQKSEQAKKEQNDFTRLCNNINSKITKLGVLRSQPSMLTNDSVKLANNMKSMVDLKQNGESSCPRPLQDSNISEDSSQIEKKDISRVKENLFEKYAKAKLVSTNVSDIAFSEDDESNDSKDLKLKNTLWDFNDDSTESDKPNKSLNISFFDNTATEDGMQLAVDKVVQKILTEISDDSDTNEVSSSLLAKLTDGQVCKTVVPQKDGSFQANVESATNHAKKENLDKSKCGTAELSKSLSAETPKVECMNVLRIENANNAKVSKLKGADIPKPGGAEAPKPGGAEVPKPGGGEAPEPGDAEAPKPGSADIPESGMAAIPEAEGDEILTAESAEVPKAEGAELPKAEGAEVPEASGAAVPEASGAAVPEASGAEVPEAKAVEADVPMAVDSDNSTPEDADVIMAEGAKVLDIVEPKLQEQIQPSLETAEVKKPVIAGEMKPESHDGLTPTVIKLKNEDGLTEEVPTSKRSIPIQETDGACEKKLKTEETVSLSTAYNVIKSAAQIAKDKTESELKRKWMNDKDEKPMDILTVKKVKLDPDSVREEVKLALSQQKTGLKPEALPLDVKKESKYSSPNKISKHELDDYIAKRINLYVTQDEKSEIGVLKLKCEYLEKSVDKWKKKASTMQKQITEMHIALQRAIHVRKTTPVPTKIQVPTRSVGLQVQLNSLHPVPDKQLPRHISVPPAGATVKRLPLLSSTSQAVVMNKNATTAGNVTIINPGKPTPTPTLQSMISKPPLISSTIAARPLYNHSTTTVSAVQIPSMSLNTTRPNVSMLSSIAPRPTPTYTAAKPTTSCVSILQPRITNSQPMTGPVTITSIPPGTVPTSSVPKVASVIPPSSPTVRTLLDSRRMQTTMSPSGPPVPMRLVPNQAAVKQAGPLIRPPAPACQPGQAVASGPATPATVKIIDLTADEDEGNNLQTSQVQTIIPTVVSAAISSSAASLGQMSTVTTQRPVTIIPASQTTSMAGGQLFINTSPASGTMTVSTSSSPMAVRMATPIRSQAPPSTLMAQQGQRVAYLVPSTMVRPTQQLFVNQPGMQARPVQQMAQITQPNILKPPIQTILLQRGTTLYPVAQAPVQTAPTSQPMMRPTTQPTILRTTQTTTTTTQVQTSSPRPPPPPLQIMPKQAVPRFNSPSTQTSTQTSGEQQSGQPVVVSKVIHKHPAPLPPCAVDLESSPGLKTAPPKPALKISRVNNGIVLSWNMSLTPKHAEIARYQLYAYQESNAPPSTTLWKKVGDVKALPLPMACTLTQFMEGHKYHFAVRAVDVHDRIGPFSEPGSIVLNSPNTPASSAPSGIRL